MARQSKTPIRDLYGESIGATILGGAAGVLVGLLFWYQELTGWDRYSVTGEIHLLPEWMRESWLIFGVMLLLFAAVGATVAVLINLKRHSRPWKRSWDKRGGSPKNRRRR